METSTETAKWQPHSSREIQAEISGQCFATSIKYSGKIGRNSQRPSGPIKANRDLASSLESSSRFSQMAWKQSRLPQQWRLLGLTISPPIVRSLLGRAEGAFPLSGCCGEIVRKGANFSNCRERVP